jgi:hypothetical protein
VAGGPVVRIDEIPAPVVPGADQGSATPSILTRVALRFDKITRQDQERITCHILAAQRQRGSDSRAAATPPGDASAGVASDPPAQEAEPPAPGAEAPGGASVDAGPDSADSPA